MQQFAVKEEEKTLLGQKLIFFNVLAQGASDKEFLAQVQDVWQRLVSLAYGVDAGESKEVTRRNMLAEYEKIKKLRPRFKISKDGKISVSGLEVSKEKFTK